MSSAENAQGRGRKGGGAGQDGAMLIRLSRVRPGGETLPTRAEPADVPAVPEETAPQRRVPLPQRTDQGVRLVGRSPSLDRLIAASRPRFSGSAIAFLIMVMLPTLIAGVYFTFIASPQYVSEFRFSVRGQDGMPTDSLSAATAVNPIAILADNFLVADFATSRDVVDELEKSVGLRKIYGSSDLDWLSRFNETGSIEDLVRYWKGKVDAHFDMTTGINTISVRAFSPEEAHTLAVALERMCEQLVNDISQRARQTQLQYAEDQVARAEDKLKEVRARETAFRAKMQTPDASRTAAAQIDLSAKIEAQLADMKTEYDTVSRYLDKSSPRIKVLRDQIDATEAQLATINGRVSGNGQGPTQATDAASIAEFENIQTDSDIALKIYEAALQSFEQARLKATTNQLFLATYVQPSRPEEAAFPRRFLDTFLFFLAAVGIWIISTLVFYSIRDHAH